MSHSTQVVQRIKNIKEMFALSHRSRAVSDRRFIPVLELRSFFFCVVMFFGVCCCFLSYFEPALVFESYDLTVVTTIMNSKESRYIVL